MYIKHVHIENFKRFKGSFDIDFNEHLNILVGDNEAGKSTIIEAVYLALTGIYNGHYLRNDISQYLFNYEVIEQYVASLKTATPLAPPTVLIELYFDGEGIALFEGDDNSTGEGASGISFSIRFDERFQDEYQELIQSEVKTLPIEYYDVFWTSFSRRGSITSKSVPIKPALIDSDSGKMLNGSDIYVSRIVKDSLDTKEIVGVTQAFRSMQQSFMSEDIVTSINNKLKDNSKISNKNVEISVDLSSRNAWESNLMTYLDKIPFPYIGKGEQSIVKTKLALGHKRTENASMILMEEPENHLSHSKLNELLHHIKQECGEKQLLIATHSSYVANKLGLNSLILLANNRTLSLNSLSAGTRRYFESLPGYDTLRMILCNKSILVEGPSDELVVSRAYLDQYNKLPIEDNIDVISVGNLSFLRFLEIANELQLNVSIVTDNDGNIAALQKKYANYLNSSFIHICYDQSVDDTPTEINGKPYNCNTLEPKLLKVNSITKLNNILGKKFTNDEDLLAYMKDHKTECALSILESKDSIEYPQYIMDSFV